MIWLRLIQVNKGTRRIMGLEVRASQLGRLCLVRLKELIIVTIRTTRKAKQTVAFCHKPCHSYKQSTTNQSHKTNLNLSFHS